MELLVIYWALALLVLASIPLAFVCGFIVGLWIYGKPYWDGAEKTGDRYWPWFCSWRIWAWIRSRFHYSITPYFSPPQRNEKEKEEEWDTSRIPTLYVCYPHGVFALFVIGTFMVLPSPITFLSKKRETRVGGHWLLTAIPLLRELALWAGVVDARWNVIEAQFRAGRDVAIIPEGVWGMGTPMGTDPRQIHRHFLKRVYDSPTPIQIRIVYCPNEKLVCKCWSVQSEWKIIAAIRRACIAAVGYPFPTIFLGPWPFRGAALTTTISEPIHANKHAESLEELEHRFDAVFARLKTQEEEEKNKNI